MVKIVKMTHDPALDIDQGRKISDSIFEFVRTSKKRNKITFHHHDIFNCGSLDPTTYSKTTNLEFSGLFQPNKFFLKKKKKQ